MAEFSETIINSTNDYDFDRTEVTKLIERNYDKYMSTDTFGGKNQVCVKNFSDNLKDISPIRQNKSSVDASKSKSYILAMKSLQQKLDRKENKIKELQKIILRLRQQLESRQPTIKAETAKFGLTEERHKISLAMSGKRTSALDTSTSGGYAAPAFQGSAYKNLKENLSPNNGVLCERSQKKSVANHREGLIGELKKLEAINEELKEDNIELARQLHESQKRANLLEKKFELCKEENEGLTIEMQESAKKMVMLEEENRNKEKDNERMSSAIENLEELINIISGKKVSDMKKAGLPGLGFSTNGESQLLVDRIGSQKHFEPVQGGHQSYHHPQARNHVFDEKGVFSMNSQAFRNTVNNDCSESSFSHEIAQRTNPDDELLLDIVNHVLVNRELTYQHLDLFNHMKARLLENQIFFKNLEDNYDFLKETKDSMMKKDLSSIDGYSSDRIEDDVMTIDTLLSLIRGFLTLRTKTETQCY